MTWRTGSVLGSFLGCLAIAGLGLWIIFAIANSSDSPKPSAGTPRRPLTAGRATAEDSAGPTHPPVDPAEVKSLAQQRQYAMDMLAAIDGILKAPSFAVRADRYCRFTVDQVEALAMPAGKGAEERYQQLLREEPITREGEVNRQQALAAMEELVTSHRENLRQCKSLVTMGMQRMPSETELRDKARQVEREIEEINGRIAAISSRPSLSKLPTAESESRDAEPREMASDAAATAPLLVSPPLEQPPGESGSSSQPVLLYRVEPEYSEEARRANFNGDVHVSIVIDERGRVTNVRVLNSPGLGLDPKIVEAVSKWQFRPAVKDGSPVPTTGTITLTFRHS